MPRNWLKPAPFKIMTQAEAAWLAGFFDGEGSLVRTSPRHSNHSFKLSIPNTHLESLEYVVNITGTGAICKKYDATTTRKAQWAWQLQRQRAVVGVLRQIQPFLVTKRDAVTSFLATWKDV